MPDFQVDSFFDLVALGFASRAPESAWRGRAAELETVSSPEEFDLFLWSLGQSLKVDTEELMRQLGEAWLGERDGTGAGAAAGVLEVLERIVTTEGLLAAAPVPGMAAFRVEVLARSGDSLRLRCGGARRCCSFLEGVARGVGARHGVSLRYRRQPKRSRRVEITFSVISRF